jgi:hypothetical protein
VTATSPKYGLTASTRKPVTVACNELSRAINALDRHNVDERDGFDENLASASAVAAALPDGEAAAAARAIDVIKQAAARLRVHRNEALQPMLALRAQLVDALLEAQDMLPADARHTAHVEPGSPPPMPRPVGGLEPGAADWVRVLAETYRWTRDLTLGNAALAIGPAYLLGYVIEHPTPEASKLRADAQAIGDHARRLIHRASRNS